MKPRNKIILYSVPNIEKVSGGPRVRVTKISEVIEESGGYSIIGGSFKKLKRTLQSPKSEICYVESATNRIKLIDAICLLLLKLKTEKFIVYIRDVYTITFPEEYKSLRKSLTKTLFYLTNIFFIQITDIFAFPTKEMGVVYNRYFNSNKKSIALPPGTFETPNSKAKSDLPYLKKPSFLYLGGTNYKFSGFNNYLDFAAENIEKFDFHILSPDQLDERFLEKGIKEKIYYTSVPHKKVHDYIIENEISFLIHPRPLNSYDAITYPIKIMDCISFGLPIISFRNSPMVSLLGTNYPFFVNNMGDILTLFKDQEELIRKYQISLKVLEKTVKENSYRGQVQKIVDSIHS